MKKIIVSLALASVLLSCKSTVATSNKQEEVKVTIDLIDVKDDKVQVTILAPKIKLKRKNKPPELLIIRHEARIEHAKEREIRRKARAKRLFRNLK